MFTGKQLTLGALAVLIAVVALIGLPLFGVWQSKCVAAPKGFELLGTSDDMKLLTFKVGEDRLYIAQRGTGSVAMVHTKEYDPSPPLETGEGWRITSWHHGVEKVDMQEAPPGEYVLELAEDGSATWSPLRLHLLNRELDVLNSERERKDTPK